MVPPPRMGGDTSACQSLHAVRIVLPDAAGALDALSAPPRAFPRDRSEQPILIAFLALLWI